jgi:flagella synthesis protein FlgN
MDDIAYLVGQESSALDELISALREEQAILKSGRADDLAAVIDRKNRQLETLARHGRRRNELLASRGLKPDRDGIAAWSRSSGQEDLGAAFLALADEARELNHLNGQLIAMRLQATQSALSTLAPDRSGQGLYGPSGKTSFASGYRLIDSA